MKRVAVALAGLGLAAMIMAPTPSFAGQEVATGSSHDLTLGYWGTSLWSKGGHQYTVQAASLGYSWAYAREGVGPLLRVQALLPFRISEDGRVYDASDPYSPRMGADLLAGVQWWLPAGAGLSLELGGGLHAALIGLTGRPGYASWSAAPMGLGGAANLRWNWPGSGWHLGLAAGLSADFYDPLRSNDLAFGLGWSAMLLLGHHGATR